MKKLQLMLIFCVCVLIASAQQQLPEQTFAAYSNDMNQKMQQGAELKDRKLVLQLMTKWMDRYDRQPKAIQDNYKSYLLNIYYNMACYQALDGRKELAIANFQKAVDAGYKNYALTLKDSDLLSLRKDKRFKSALRQMREKGDYVYLLKQAGRYEAKSSPPVSGFIYQSSTAPELIEFRKRYNLDSISGNGDEISRMKNLLKWVHNTVRHDGNSTNPASKNGTDLIEICRKENRGVNCRMLATILKDAYQADGFASRAVTCMPKDTADFDCHVINIVWSKSLNKWLWMDPTNNAYVSDDQGKLLGIEEVRDRLVNSKPLVLNEDANWNNRQKQTKAQYLDYYMAKNLYWLQCPVRSEWDLETKNKNNAPVEYVNLYPGKYTTINGQKEQTTRSQKMYATGDSHYFWQKP